MAKTIPVSLNKPMLAAELMTNVRIISKQEKVSGLCSIMEVSRGESINKMRRKKIKF